MQFECIHVLRAKGKIVTQDWEVLVYLLECLDYNHKFWYPTYEGLNIMVSDTTLPNSNMWLLCDICQKIVKVWDNEYIAVTAHIMRTCPDFPGWLRKSHFVWNPGIIFLCLELTKMQPVAYIL